MLWIKRHLRFRWFVLAAILVCIACMVRLCTEELSDIVEITPVATVESPGHRWKAVVTQTFVEGAFAPNSDVGDDVCLAPVQGSAPCVQILYVETSGQSDDHPTVTWTSDHDLRIKLTYGQNPPSYLHDLSGVHVDVYHDVAAEAALKAQMDRDNAIREKFLRQHSQ